jgi:hypothetical protein
VVAQSNEADKIRRENDRIWRGIMRIFLGLSFGIKHPKARKVTVSIKNIAAETSILPEQTQET